MKRGVAKDLPFGASVLETSLLAPTSQHLLLQFLINTHWLVLRVPRKAWAREGVFVSERPETMREFLV